MEVTEGIQQLTRPSYLTSLKASVSLQVDQSSESLDLVRVMTWKKFVKECFYSSTWNIVFYIKSLFRSHQNCLYAFVCLTNWNFLSCKLFNKKKFITWSVWHPYLSLLLHKFAFKIRCPVCSGLSKVFVGFRFTPWVLIKVKIVPPLYSCTVFFSLTMELIWSLSFLFICSISFIQYWIHENEGIKYVIN